MDSAAPSVIPNEVRKPSPSAKKQGFLRAQTPRNDRQLNRFPFMKKKMKLLVYGVSLITILPVENM